MIRAAIFDLGNVVLFFSHEKMCRQLGEAFELSAEEVRREIFDSGFASRYDRGLVTTRELFDRLAGRAGTAAPPLAEARAAAAEIFTPNDEVIALLDTLRGQGVRLVALSNTCEVHAAHMRERYRVDELFDALVLSHEVGAAKPDREVFERAVSAAACAPSECFFTDDVPAYVEAASRLGIDAELFVGGAALRRALRARSLAL